MFRVALLTVLLVLLLIHALNGDPSWASFPEGCSSSSSSSALSLSLSSQPCMRVAANSSANAAFLQPLRLSTSLSALRLAVMSSISQRARWSVLDTRTYADDSDDGGDGRLLIRVRALTFVLGLPSDVSILLFCQDEQSAVVYLQSESRQRMPDYGLNSRHVLQLYQDIAGLQLEQTPCRQQSTATLGLASAVT